MRVFFGIENPFEELVKDCIVNITVDRPKTKFDYMREIAEDVEFEEIIETKDEDQKAAISIQSVK